MPRDIGTRLELFVDDWLIERMDRVSLRMHSPVPREVVLRFDRPWESDASTGAVVMKEPEGYRMWYRAGGSDDDQSMAYAHSSDGIHWERPSLGLIEFDGSKENNIVVKGTTAQSVCVFKDDNPRAPAEERYKAFGILRRFVDGRRDAVRGFTSPDGLRWSRLEVDPILVAPDDPWPIFDSQNIIFWDASKGHYAMYLRGWISAEGKNVPAPRGRVRSIRRSVSTDFRAWSEPEFVDLGDSPTEHLYTIACTPYYRAPHIYLMFPRRYVPGRKFHRDFPSDGVSDGVFMSSRDGVHWDRRFMEAFLRPGPDPGNWTDRSMTMGLGVVPTGAKEISVYYKGHTKIPSARFRRGTLRTDGFVSVNASYVGGEFVTRPLIFSGEELVMNYATSAAGSVRVEVQDAEGRPLEGHLLSQCAEIFGDEIERTVSWRGGTGVRALAGRPVRLRFAMKDADLYSIRFREPPA